jgi:hypothetical protein
MIEKNRLDFRIEKCENVGINHKSSKRGWREEERKVMV